MLCYVVVVFVLALIGYGNTNDFKVRRSLCKRERKESLNISLIIVIYTLFTVGRCDTVGRSYACVCMCNVRVKIIP